MSEQPLKKKRIFSGIQPSGNLHLGNYLGALRNWVLLSDEYDCFYCIVDMHAITVRQTPADLRRRSLELAALFIASGLDPEKNVIFIQSHVPAHAELAWVLNCNAYMGELSRMTQFKEKSSKQGDNIGAGLFTYPTLMAADILLYQADLVPVGSDQKQHLELTRDLAIRFNNAYGETFVVPEAYIPKAGARIMSLQDPTSKMSKSGDSTIAMLEEPAAIRKKIRRAVTDLDGQIHYDPEHKPGITNLINIYSAITHKTTEEIEQAFDGQGYGAFKDAVADVVIEELTPIQNRVKELLGEKDYLLRILNEGADKAAYVARKTLSKVYRKVGFVAR